MDRNIIIRGTAAAAFGTILSSCGPMLVAGAVHLIPQAPIYEKQYDMLADIVFVYDGHRVHATRHFSYFLSRYFNDQGQEIRRQFEMQGFAIVALSDTDAATVKIEPTPPRFDKQLSWTANIDYGYRRKSDGKCVSLDRPLPVSDLSVTLTRLPARVGGYPPDWEGIQLIQPPTGSVTDCTSHIRAGLTNTKITPLG